MSDPDQRRPRLDDLAHGWSWPGSRTPRGCSTAASEARKGDGAGSEAFTLQTSLRPRGRRLRGSATGDRRAFAPRKRPCSSRSRRRRSSRIGTRQTIAWVVLGGTTAAGLMTILVAFADDPRPDPISPRAGGRDREGGNGGEFTHRIDVGDPSDEMGRLAAGLQPDGRRACGRPWSEPKPRPSPEPEPRNCSPASERPSATCPPPPPRSSPAPRNRSPECTSRPPPSSQAASTVDQVAQTAAQAAQGPATSAIAAQRNLEDRPGRPVGDRRARSRPWTGSTTRSSPPPKASSPWPSRPRPSARSSPRSATSPSKRTPRPQRRDRGLPGRRARPRVRRGGRRGQGPGRPVEAGHRPGPPDPLRESRRRPTPRSSRPRK